MRLSYYLQPSISISLLCLSQLSFAKPIAPDLFCHTYSSTTTCEAAIECSQCHTTPPVFNDYGQAVKDALDTITAANLGSSFAESLPPALHAVESLDSDNDGQSNIVEITQGTKPYDAQSLAVVATDNLQWDAQYALQKVNVLYCGRSARYAEKQALRAASDPNAYVHQALDQCLASDYWTQEALHRLADKRIRPIFEIGVDGALGIGNYEWDYRLFSYVLSDDRDSRDLLLADYHIDENGQRINEVIDKERPFFNEMTGQLNLGSGQPLAPEKRVGMISTQWFLAYFTMFAELPRNTASQAYRAYLGLDIAKGEGLIPVAGEPRDVDGKGVAAAECAVCHSTLDPLAYAFSAYAGIEETPTNFLGQGNPYGTYYPEGTEWEADSYLFNQPVVDLKDWASVAANSDAFKKNLTSMFFNHALGADADKSYLDSYQALWPAVSTDNYSANKLIHRIVDTLDFGGK